MSIVFLSGYVAVITATLCDVSALVALHPLACPVQASAATKKATAAAKAKLGPKKAMKAMFTI